MSIVPKETVEVIAQSVGINNLSTDAALALAPDVEYRMREIMQVSFKFLLALYLVFIYMGLFPPLFRFFSCGC